jgi:hypothetical protein
MDLPKIDITSMPDLPLASSLFATPATSIDTDTMTVLMAYLYEMSA